MATAVLGYGVWVHHMYAVGIAQLPLAFFTAATLLFALPSGIQVFALITTLYGAIVSNGVFLPFAEGPIDIDRMNDWELAEKILAEREAA